MRQVRAERKKVSELQPNSRYRLFKMSIIFMIVLKNARNCGLHSNRTETPYCNFNLIVWPVITVKWMANSIVFIVMAKHMWVFTPPVHLEGKVLQGTHNVAELSATALFANPLMAYFPNCLIFVSLLQDLKTAFFFYVPEMFFTSPNSANTFSTSQDSHCTSETKKGPAEGQGRIQWTRGLGQCRDWEAP